MDNQNPQYPQQEEEESIINIDFKKLFTDVVRLWWLFLISIIIALVALHFYQKYTIPIYGSTISVIVDEQGTQSSKTQSMIDGFMLDPAMRNIDNQIAVLKSKSSISNVIEKMGIFITYYHEGNIVTTESYKFKGAHVVMDSTHVQMLNTPIYFTEIDENTFRLTVKAEDVFLYNYDKREYESKLDKVDCDVKCHYGEPIITPWGAFTLVRDKDYGPGMFFKFNDPSDIVNSYVRSLAITRDEASSSSVVSLSISGPNIAKNNDFLNTLVETFISDNLAQKNLIAENTIKFIETQLGSLSDSLTSIGTQLSSFKVNNGLQQSVSSKGERIFREMQDYEKEIQQTLINISYYDYLTDYFASDTVLNGVIAPALFDTKSSAIAQQLSQIMTLNSEKQTSQDTYSKADNPTNKAIMAKLNIARNTLLQSVQSNKEMLNENIKELRGKVKNCENELSQLPETERKLLGIDRKYTLNNDVYTFLMRKRSESQIQKASNTSDHRIIDPASATGQISPNMKKNQTMALALAIILPLGFIVIRQLLDNKIRTQDDIKKITSYPIVGEITSNHKDTPLVVIEHPKSILSEKFRRMRTRLDFMVAGKQVPVIAVTSSMPGEGKTFCAANIASVFAISGKKTVLLGMDLRKPGLTKIFNTEGKSGISNFIIGDSTLEEITVHYTDTLDVLPTGDIPPNPAELIASEKCNELIETLKGIYDVIVIDTPPMGLVSDAYTIARWIDTLVFIIRQDYTLKDAFKYTISSFTEEGIKNVALVVNDVNNKDSRYGYGYGYGHYGKYGKYGYGRYGKKYGYGYGYGYGEKDSSHGYYTED